MKYLYNDNNLKLLRKNLRNKLGLPEIILWNQLKDRNLGVKFRRQYGIDNFVLDFYCPKFRLAVELDGESHNNGKSYYYDKVRDDFIRKHGITILHFYNKDALNNLEGVLKELNKHLK